MQNSVYRWLAGLALFMGIFLASQARADSWADFRDKVIALQERLIKEKPVRVEGGKVLPFGGEAAKGFSYQDFRYFDQADGRLIAYVRRSPDAPSRIYEVEAYIYGDDGRVVRDFSAITLPWQLEHPARTFINLHDYPGDLHVFRQFDASGDFEYEACEGQLDGKKVELYLESIDVGPKLRATPLYQACFGRLPMKPGKYIDPQ